MVDALALPLEQGRLRLLCLDSVDSESWYNQKAAPRLRIVRQMEYERYVIDEVFERAGILAGEGGVGALGCSFGGYHAMNLALRHPDCFTQAIALCGVFDLTAFLGGYYDQDCYFNLPTHFLPRLEDPWHLERMRQNHYTLASGADDQCLEQNRTLDRLLTEKQIPHRFDQWPMSHCHDWPAWQLMAKSYLG